MLLQRSPARYLGMVLSFLSVPCTVVDCLFPGSLRFKKAHVLPLRRMLTPFERFLPHTGCFDLLFFFISVHHDSSVFDAL